MAIKNDALKRIKTGTLSRGIALARVSMAAGAKVASHAMGGLFSSESEKTERFKELLTDQLKMLSRELGQLKGSLMKVGQLLSMYGEHFLPPEANAVLKSLQSQSPPLEWKAIEKVLKKQLPLERLEELEIDPEPMASASLGQVHRARRKSDGRQLAIKIQYPGVDQAIEGDLKALQSILSISKLIPKGPKYDGLFKEVRTMLHQEVDYTQELEMTQHFRKVLSDDPRYIVPEVFPEYSTKRILTTTLEEGIAVDSPEVLSLSLERRNAIGVAALQLYFRELFEIGMVQTDPHFGNYRIRTSEDGNDQLVLLDFGAVRKLPQHFLRHYLEIVRGAHERNPARIIKAGEGVGFLRPEDGEKQKNLFADLCFLITEPFYEGVYDWGASDLPKRVARRAGEFAVTFKLRSPPREVVFLDRKMGGMFIFLSVLKAQLNGRLVVQRFFQ